MSANDGSGVRCTDVVRHLRELISKATPGPWCDPNPDNCLGHLECREIGYIGHLELHSPSSPFQRAEPKADYALIVAAVNALPALLEIAEVSRALIRGGYLDDEINAKNPLVLNLVDVVGDDRLPNTTFRHDAS